MDQIESIIASYNKIIDELDSIDKQIRNLAIMVGQAQGVLARCESDIIEAKYACDPDMPVVSHYVVNLIKKQW